MGHITLGIADIEFVQSDEILLDDDDVILLAERPAARRSTVARHTPTRSPSRPRPMARAVPEPAIAFDDMQTTVRAVPRLARAR